MIYLPDILQYWICALHIYKMKYWAKIRTPECSNVRTYLRMLQTSTIKKKSKKYELPYSKKNLLKDKNKLTYQCYE